MTRTFLEILLGWLVTVLLSPAPGVIAWVATFLALSALWRSRGRWPSALVHEDGRTGLAFIASYLVIAAGFVLFLAIPPEHSRLAIAGARHQFFSNRTWFALDLKNPGTLDACDVVAKVWLLDEHVVALDPNELGACVAAGGPGNTMMTSAQRRLDTRGIVYAVVCFDGGRLDGFWVYDPQIGPQMPMASPEEQDAFLKAAGPALASDSACDGRPLLSSPHSGQ